MLRDGPSAGQPNGAPPSPARIWATMQGPQVSARIVDVARTSTTTGIDGPTRYLIEVVHVTGIEPPYVIARRYSQFAALRDSLGAWALRVETAAEQPDLFPPKRMTGSWQAAVVVERALDVVVRDFAHAKVALLGLDAEPAQRRG